MNLTDDERTVLMICDRSESVAAIGRWEQPCDHLVELGYLRRTDKLNHFITEAGHLAISAANEEVEDAFAHAILKLHNTRVEYKREGDEAARWLAQMAKKAAAATGDDILQALRKCGEAVVTRAADFLND